MTNQEIRQLVASVPHWYHKIELAPGIVTPGGHESAESLKLLGLPDSMTGMRVLDVGARDGFFSFECERRGAEVVPIDYAPPEETGFVVAARILGSKLKPVQENVFDVTAEKYGTFDLVLFLGVLYHLRDPLRAIDQLRTVCRGRMILETHVIDESLLLENGKTRQLKELHPALKNIPLMQFYPGDSLRGDATNYWGPNMRCVEAMLEEANFSVTRSILLRHRAVFWCGLKSDLKLEYLAQIGRGVI